MRRAMLPAILGVLIAGIPIVRAEDQGNDPARYRLTIIPTGIHQPDVLKINTGKKAMMKDGEDHTVYDTVTPKKDRILLEIAVDLSVEPGPLFLETSMIQLAEGKRPSSTAVSPIYWYVDSGPEPARADTVTIASQAGLVFTFDVPAARADSLALWISGLRIASVREIRERLRGQGE